jgi:retron-type reverse transcriptase
MYSTVEQNFSFSISVWIILHRINCNRVNEDLLHVSLYSVWSISSVAVNIYKRRDGERFLGYIWHVLEAAAM